MSSAERYACEACGHRGWRIGKVEDRRAPPAPPVPAGAARSTGGQRSRPPRLNAGLQSLQAALFALLLGAIAALLILRMGAGPR